VLAAALVLPVAAPDASATPVASARARAHKQPSACTDAGLRPTGADAAAIDAATLCLIDQVRAAYHLGSLRVNRELQTVATAQVDDMVRWNYFTDNRPPARSPASLIAATHYSAHAASLSIGQNIGWGTGADATPAQMVAAWMASPPHREIILTGEYRDAGVGVVPAVPSVLAQPLPGATYAIEFATRA
jgi:uncharacterized protein YkwD